MKTSPAAAIQLASARMKTETTTAPAATSCQRIAGSRYATAACEKNHGTEKMNIVIKLTKSELKYALFILLAASPCLAALTPAQENKLADAIYIVEGGAKTAHPYGVLAKYKTTTPRQACINTIKTKRRAWEAAGSRGDWLNYLADRYCPPSSDPVGNRNWKANIHKLMFTDTRTGGKS